ncbi:MAG TPA: helix-hairpin-helix domain-containing protein [Blastocatellia bacterium]|jgi:DNA polymerase (family 10)|nr:helix-hairpin-helix domain-containing protein [Blastocatellia bacterium]
MNDAGAGYDGKLSVDNRDVAGVFKRIADLLEFKDENPFKLRSYRVASETIDELHTPVAEMASRGGASELQKIPGIGKSISAQILEVLQTGTSSFFEALKEEIPESVLDLKRVSGIGLKTAQLLYRDFGIKSLEELKAFVDGGGLLSVPGLGEKTLERIKASLARIESERGMLRLNDANELARSIMAKLAGDAPDSADPTKTRAEAVGQIRRGCEMVDSVEILATGDAALLAGSFASFPQIATVKSIRPERVEAETKAGVAVVLHIASARDRAAALVRTTGSLEHVRDLESEAAARGLEFKGFRLGPASSGRKKGRSKVTSADPGSLEPASEEEFYRQLGLETVPPELREGAGEVEAARTGKLPDLISLGDIRGDFHMHTKWSDGQNTVREMIEAARAIGLEYIAITDHTQSTSIANGNTPEELLKEIEEIESVAGEYTDIRVFKGAEVDILSDGSLDMPFDVLDRLDWVVCSIHAGFHQERQQITDRVIRAMETGYPNVFAHPTGRILGERPPYEIDLDQVIAAARKFNVRLELNASPYRLDLNSFWLRVATQAGVGIVISTDSHQAKGLSNMSYGIATARRAGLTKREVLNTLPLPGLLSELETKKAMRRH